MYKGFFNFYVKKIFIIIKKIRKMISSLKIYINNFLKLYPNKNDFIKIYETKNYIETFAVPSQNLNTVDISLIKPININKIKYMENNKQTKFTLPYFIPQTRITELSYDPQFYSIFTKNLAGSFLIESFDYKNKINFMSSPNLLTLSPTTPCFSLSRFWFYVLFKQYLGLLEEFDLLFKFHCKDFIEKDNIIEKWLEESTLENYNINLPPELNIENIAFQDLKVRNKKINLRLKKNYYIVPETFYFDVPIEFFFINNFYKLKKKTGTSMGMEFSSSFGTSFKNYTIKEACDNYTHPYNYDIPYEIFFDEKEDSFLLFMNILGEAPNFANVKLGKEFIKRSGQERDYIFLTTFFSLFYQEIQHSIWNRCGVLDFNSTFFINFINNVGLYKSVETNKNNLISSDITKLKIKYWDNNFYIK